MIKISSFLLLGILFLTSAYAQQEKKVLSKVTEVTVYVQGAQVLRTTKFNLEKGENRVVFYNLPPSIDESSIQVSCGEATIVSVSYQKNMLDSLTQNQEYQKLQVRKKELSKKINVEKALLQTIDTEKEVLLSNKKLVGDQGVKLEDLKNSMVYFRSRLEELERSRIDKVDVIDELEKELEKIKEQSLNLYKQKITSTSEVLVTFIANQPILANAVLKYYTQDASWNPSYDVRISSINKPLNITYKANVTQTTGEDWTKVKLSIASGNPTTGSTAPTIYPWDLNIIEPYLSKKNNRSVSEETKNEEVFLVAEEMPSFNKPSDNNAPSIPLTISENQTNFSFNIDIPYDIPSKQQPTITILQTPSINATYKYSTVPKLSEYAYLVASMTDWQNLNLINGNANLYFENNYVGSTYLDTKAFGDTLKLSMGKDESMSVRRTKTKSFTEKNIIGSKVTETRNWEITITNGKKQDAEISLEDQVPVSSNEKIKVKLLEQSNANYNSATGILKWNLLLKSSETKKITFSYSVEYPKEYQISLE